MNFEAVLFDADETIFNNQGIHLVVTKLILDDLDLPESMVHEVHSRWDVHYFTEKNRTMDEIGYCIDRENNAKSLVKAMKDFDIELPLEQATKYWNFMIKEYSTKSKPYPDVLALIDRLHERAIKMAIVSNGDQEIINLRLENAKIDHHFEFVIAPCEDYPLTKPDLKIFAESLEMLQTKAEKTVFIGDNPDSDIVGANQAGMFSVLIDRYKTMDNLEGMQIPKLKINNFTEMLDIFD